VIKGSGTIVSSLGSLTDAKPSFSSFVTSIVSTIPPTSRPTVTILEPKSIAASDSMLGQPPSSELGREDDMDGLDDEGFDVALGRIYAGVKGDPKDIIMREGLSKKEQVLMDGDSLCFNCRHFPAAKQFHSPEHATA
jgi:hypothetical protein